jgi:DNA-binding transcriptional ArsR family regulator
MDPVQIVTEPRRREILRLVWERELSAGEIAGHFDRTFGAVSQHLAILRAAGFVSVRAEGNRRYYLADRQALGPLRAVLEAMWSTTLDRLADAVEGEPGA